MLDSFVICGPISASSDVAEAVPARPSESAATAARVMIVFVVVVLRFGLIGRGAVRRLI